MMPQGRTSAAEKRFNRAGQLFRSLLDRALRYLMLRPGRTQLGLCKCRRHAAEQAQQR